MDINQSFGPLKGYNIEDQNSIKTDSTQILWALDDRSLYSVFFYEKVLWSTHEWIRKLFMKAEARQKA